MNEFVETQEERDALSYLDWSDERIGQLVRWFAGKIRETDASNAKPVKLCAAFLVLADNMVSMNATSYKITADDFYIGDNVIGDVEMKMRVKEKKIS